MLDKCAIEPALVPSPSTWAGSLCKYKREYDQNINISNKKGKGGGREIRGIREGENIGDAHRVRCLHRIITNYRHVLRWHENCSNAWCIFQYLWAADCPPPETRCTRITSIIQTNYLFTHSYNATDSML